MNGDHQKPHHRRSIRLKQFDYALAGAYFVTICTFARQSILGEVIDGAVRLSHLGQIVDEEWRRTSDLRPNVATDMYVVMPNHLHGILVVSNGHPADRAQPFQPDIRRAVAAFASPSATLGAMIRGFKAATTRRASEMEGTLQMPVWQRNYYERVIRNGSELDRIREYIAGNPLRWDEDENNPARRGG